MIRASVRHECLIRYVVPPSQVGPDRCHESSNCVVLQVRYPPAPTLLFCHSLSGSCLCELSPDPSFRVIYMARLRASGGPFGRETQPTYYITKLEGLCVQVLVRSHACMRGICHVIVKQSQESGGMMSTQHTDRLDCFLPDDSGFFCLCVFSRCHHAVKYLKLYDAGSFIIICVISMYSSTGTRA